jgi:arylsulfatase A-like enzyme
VLRKLREIQDYEDHFRDETHVRMAVAAYYGMVSFLDDNIGQVLRALEASGLHGALWPLEIRPLRGLSAAALRP